MEIDSKQKLLEAAQDLFAQKGFASVSIRDIALQAGVNSALISYHFKGKEGLYTAVLEKQFEFMLHFAERINVDHLTPKEKVRQYADKVLATHQRSPYIIRFFYSELSHPSPALEWISKQFLEKLFLTFHNILADGVAQGQFKKNLNLPHAVISLAGIINFYFIFRPFTVNFAMAHESSPTEYVKQAIDIYLAGICTEEGET